MRYLILRTGYIFWSTSVGFCFFALLSMIPGFSILDMASLSSAFLLSCVLPVTPPPLLRYLDYSLFSLEIWVNGHHDIKTIKTPTLGENNE